MNSRELALLGCLAPIFVVLDEFTFVVPVPISLCFLYIFSGARHISYQALVIANIFGLFVNGVLFLGNVLMLVLIFYNVFIDISSAWIIKREGFEFSNATLYRIAWAWMLIPVISIIISLPDAIMMFDFVYLMLYLIVMFETVALVGLINGVVFASIFNTFKDRVMRDVMVRINGVLIDVFGMDMKRSCMQLR
jgi:hypothetical protein